VGCVPKRYSVVGSVRFRRRDERGAALVEFALIAPLLFAVLLGIFSGGNAYFEKITITDAVREGTRFGASLLGPSSASWPGTVQQRTMDLGGGELTLDDICVRVVEKTAGGESIVNQILGTDCDTEATPPPTPAGVPTGDCVVKVWSRTPTKLEAILYSQTLHITAKSLAVYERDCP
jgi:Flp pilus assembly pilin Flp